MTPFCTLKRGLSLGVLLSAILAASASGEVVVLKSGGRIAGEVANPDRSGNDPVVIIAESGLRFSLNAAQVKRVLVQTEVEKQYEEALPKVPPTVEGHWEMARWCGDAELSEQRTFHLEEVVRLDPDHEEARRLLGYTNYDGQWLKPDEWKRKQGYVFFQGQWRLPHEVEIVKREQGQKEATIKWRQDLKRWLGWLESGKRTSAALANIKDIRDEAAAPALVELLADDQLPRSLRLMFLDVLRRFPAHYSASTLVKLAMKDADDELRDKCVEELRRQRSTLALHSFIKDLKSKDNRVVRRAAYCLGILADPEATVPLIDALVTSHKFQVTVGGSPGQIGAGFGGRSDGGDGGLGSFNFGSPKPRIITRDLTNDTALAALTSLHPNTNFGYDEKRWKAWIIDNKTAGGIDLRRGE